jgi:hypothetical protein
VLFLPSRAFNLPSSQSTYLLPTHTTNALIKSNCKSNQNKNNSNTHRAMNVVA